jgi:hypothetical protein
MSFHVNPQTGNPGACRAKPGNCPFGSEEEHYASKDAARAGYEEAQASFIPVKKTKSKLGANGYLKPEWHDKIELHDMNCPDCGAALKASHVKLMAGNDWAYCACGKRMDFGDVEIKLTPANPSYRFLDKEEVKKETWFHASYKEDWLQNPEKGEDFEAHVGTEDAAFDRALTVYATRSSLDQPFYLYEVKLDDSVTVSDRIAVDENDTEVTEHDADVTRYINKWEAPASISLALSASKLIITGKRLVEPAEAYERLSVYNMADEEPEEDRAEEFRKFMGYEVDYLSK